MSLTHDIKRLLVGTKKQRRANYRRPRRLSMESLETRSLLSAVPFETSAAYSTEDAAGSVESALIASVQSQAATTDSPSPVLMVISNQDFWYQDYSDTRAALEAAGLEVVVAATTTEVARPHNNSGQGADGGFVRPDLALTDVEAEGYSAVVFVGGWGMAQYQYGFEGTYDNGTYNGGVETKQVVNDLINDFVEQDKHVAAICYGVSVLAYARVDGASPLAGQDVTGWNGPAPSIDCHYQSSRAQIESSGASMFASGAIGDPTTATDDVFIDGKIITAENYDAATRFGEVIAEQVLADHQAALDEANGDGTDNNNGDNGGDSDPTTDDQSDSAEEAPNTDDAEAQGPKPVLMVIANQDFYHREYYETRESLEAAGLEVIVAAATTETAVPHAISVVEGREPLVDPDIALTDVNAEDYSSIVFVGGYGAASYQYAYEGTYDYAAYRGDAAVKQIVNELCGDFVVDDKTVAAICNGVSVLAWARVDGVSPLAGHTVSAWADTLPSANGGEVQVTRDHIEANGATQVASGSIGDTSTATDDVIVDGNIITAENYDSASRFGEVLAEQLIAQHDAAQQAAHDQAFAELAYEV